MLESNVDKTEVFYTAQLDRILGLHFWLLFHQLVVIVDGGFCFPVRKNDVSNFLQGAKNEEREELHRNHFVWLHLVFEHQPHQQKQDDLTQGVDQRALQETDAPDSFYFGEFQAEYFVGICIQPLDFLLCQAKTLYQLNVSEALCGGSRQRGGSADNFFLDQFYFFAQGIGSP